MSVTYIITGIFIVGFLVYIYFSHKRMNSMKKVPDSKRIKIMDNRNFKALTNKGVVLVDFWAPWCGPCKMIAPVLNEIAENQNINATIAKLNVDNNQQIAGKLKIKSIPTLILFKDGKEIDRFMGYKSKSFLLKKINLANSL
ncbi:MAG: thioredoxin [Bacteroidales bacterium]